MAAFLPGAACRVPVTACDRSLPPRGGNGHLSDAQRDRPDQDRPTRESTAMTDISPFDPALFRDAAIDAETAALNAKMIELMEGQPEWWITGAANARAARRRGEGPFPPPVMSSRARTIVIPGKEGDAITLRIIDPPQAP